MDENPTLQDVWRLLGMLNKRISELGLRVSERFDVVDNRIVALHETVATLESRMQAGFGALKGSIEARDFRLDEQARRLSKLENPGG